MNVTIPHTGMNNTLVTIAQERSHDIGLHIGITVNDTYFRQLVKVSHIKIGTGGMALQRFHIIENLTIQHISQRTGVRRLESLYIHRIGLHGSVSSQNQTIHGYYNAFAP